jgi:hypothetical protein
MNRTALPIRSNSGPEKIHTLWPYALVVALRFPEK